MLEDGEHCVSPSFRSLRENERPKAVKTGRTRPARNVTVDTQSPFGTHRYLVGDEEAVLNSRHVSEAQMPIPISFEATQKVHDCTERGLHNAFLMFHPRGNSKTKRLSRSVTSYMLSSTGQPAQSAILNRSLKQLLSEQTLSEIVYLSDRLSRISQLQ